MGIQTIETDTAPSFGYCPPPCTKAVKLPIMIKLSSSLVLHKIINKKYRGKRRGAALCPPPHLSCAPSVSHESSAGMPGAFKQRRKRRAELYDGQHSKWDEALNQGALSPFCLALSLESGFVIITGKSQNGLMEAWVNANTQVHKSICLEIHHTYAYLKKLWPTIHCKKFPFSDDVMGKDCVLRGFPIRIEFTYPSLYKVKEEGGPYVPLLHPF